MTVTTPAPSRALPPAPPVERLGYTVAELARACGLHPATIRDRITGGEIPFVRIGWQYVIPASVVREMFATAKL